MLMASAPLSRRAFVAAAADIAWGPSLPRMLSGQEWDVHGDPMVAAEEISKLEVISHISALYEFYALMHPDAQAIVPRHVVIRYFREVFQERAPEPAVATGVTYKDWTWGVNGVTYPGTAEVSFRQEYGDGSVKQDVVRLVQHDNTWRWFFGRDRAWVDQQIQRFTQTLNVPQEGTVPYGLENVVLSDDLLNRLPETLGDGLMRGILSPIEPHEARLPDWTDDQVSLRYETSEQYPVGFVQLLSMKRGTSISQAIRGEIETYEKAPPFTLHGWHLLPDNGTTFAHYEIFGSHAVGNALNVMWGRASGDRIAVISHVDEASLQAIATALLNA